MPHQLLDVYTAVVYDYLYGTSSFNLLLGIQLAQAVWQV